MDLRVIDLWELGDSRFALVVAGEPSEDRMQSCDGPVRVFYHIFLKNLISEIVNDVALEKRRGTAIS